MPRSVAPELRAKAIGAALAGASLRDAGALVGADASSVSRWISVAEPAARAILQHPDREALGRSYLDGAAIARERLLERLASGEEPAREIAYCLRVLADVGLRILGWQQSEQRATYIGGQHVHAGNQAPQLDELSDAELDARIAAARAVVSVEPTSTSTSTSPS